MKVLKKTLVLFLCTLFMVSLVGTAAAEKVTLNWPCIWVGVDSKAETIKKFVDEFNKENAGKIEVIIEENSDYQAYRDKLRTAISVGNAPDIFTIDADIPLYLESGRLLDLTDAFKDGWQDDFVEGALANTTVDGRVVAIPYEMGVTPVMYNKRLLQEAGWDRFPETFDELWECADDLKAAGVTPFSQMTGENAWTTMLWYSQVVVAIGGPDVYDNPEHPAFVEAARVIKKMFDYTTLDAVGAGAGASGGHFLAERTAIFMNGPWYIGRLQTDGLNNMYEHVAIAPCPVYEGGLGSKGGYVGNPQALLAAGATDDQAKAAAVIKFMKYLTTPERVAQLSAASGALFYVRSVDSGPAMERLQAEMVEQINLAPYIVGHFEYMSPAKVYNEFPMALAGLVLGELTPEQFMQQLNAKR